MFETRHPEVLCSGPAGTGKSRGVMEKLFHVCQKYPRTRALICRKTRESITNTILPIWEDEVLPPDSGVKLHSRDQRYTFPNGSVVVVAGLNKDTRLFSSQYDFIYVNECNELAEGEWESLLRSMRAGVVPYKQIVGDCNPDVPTHWLLARAARGHIEHIVTRHVDNPTVDERYLALLASLTGVRRDRLYLGKWVAAEGQVYPAWESPPGSHLVDRFDPPPDWPAYWSVDFGFTNPFVWGDWRQDPDGRLYLYREIYMTGRTVREHAQRIKALTGGEPPPRALVCDHDAENAAVLAQELGLRTTNAFKAFDPGFEAVETRLGKAGDGRPRLFLMRGALVEADPELREKKWPTCTAEEFPGYVWDVDPKTGRPLTRRLSSNARPLDKDDHGMDMTRYLVAHVDQVHRGLNRIAPPIASPETSLWIAVGRRGAPFPGSAGGLPSLPTLPRQERNGWRPRFGR